MIGVILAAGRGTRLSAIGVETPKPLVAVAGVPAVDRVVDGLLDADVAGIVVVTGHRADEVEAHLAGRSAPVRCVRQLRQLGTADALMAARRSLGDSRFLVAWADVVVRPVTYRIVIDGATGVDGALAVNELADVTSGAAVTVVDSVVSRIEEKPGHAPPVPGCNNSGIMCLEPSVWPHIEAVEASPRGEYELPDAINTWIGDGAVVRAVPVEGYWFDIGTPGTLATASDRVGQDE